jgi:arylsulfatase A-like enzyme
MEKVIFFLFIFIFVSTGCKSDSAQYPEKPNILFIIVDDLGWTDLSTGVPNLGHGSPYYETLNVDHLAAKGMSFTNAYTCGPNCAPTRAALMSGQYGTRTKMYTVGNPNRSKPEQRALEAADNKLYLDLAQETLAEALKTAGYVTGHFGKWHLGGYLGGGRPEQQGFDLNIAGTNRGGSTGGFFANEKGAFPPRGNLPQMPGLPPNGKAGEWLDDRVTSKALEFMQKHHDEPFFVYMSFFAVHTPISAPKEDIAYFDNKSKSEYHDNQTYAGFIKSFDDNVGRLIDYLEKTDDPRNKGKKLVENSIIIFYSDNGGLGGYARSGIVAKEVTDQFPLRDGKGSLKEGGIRVPLIIRWDSRVKAGSITDVPVTTVDFYPTLTEIVQAKLPDNLVLDGKSLLPIFKNQEFKERALFWHFPAYLQGSKRKNGNLDFRTTPASVIREGKWKLLYYYENEQWELYNLHEDIGEHQNLIQSHVNIANKLAQKLVRWLKETNADLPRDKETKKEVELPLIPSQ